MIATSYIIKHSMFFKKYITQLKPLFKKPHLCCAFALFICWEGQFTPVNFSSCGPCYSCNITRIKKFLQARFKKNPAKITPSSLELLNSLLSPPVSTPAASTPEMPPVTVVIEPPPLAPIKGDQLSTLYLSVTLNGQNKGDIYLFLYDGKEFYVLKETLQSWGLKVPDKQKFSFDNQDYYPISAYPQATYQLDLEKLHVDIQIPADLLPKTKISSPSRKMQYDLSGWGGYLNYVFYGYRNQSSPAQKVAYQSNLFLDANIFNALGVASTQLKINGPGDPTKDTLFRLASSITVDQPEKMVTWRLGDALTGGTTWSGSLNFGGIQWSRNFQTNPDFITYPLPSLTGIAAFPSVSNLYVNGVLQNKTDLAPGPYVFDNIPIVDGKGNIKLITSDILGHQYVVELPYYSSRLILKEGLQDFSYEAGLVRLNLGSQSNQYGAPILSGTQRYGLTKALTSEWHAQLMPEDQLAGLGINTLVSTEGVISLALAGSHHKQKATGALMVLGAQTHRSYWGFSNTLELKTPYFSPLGNTSSLAPALTERFSLGGSFAKNSLGLVYLYQLNRQQPNNSLFSLTYSRGLASRWSLLATLSESLGQKTFIDNFSAMVSLNFAFADRFSTSASIQQNGKDPKGKWELNRSLPNDIGYGYQLSSEIGQNASQQASLNWRTKANLYSLQATRQNQSNAESFRLEGSIATLKNEGFYWGNTITNSFGIVDLAGVSHIGIYTNNTLIGKTNRKGKLIAPNLIPYRENIIRIKVNDLPLNMVAPDIEKSVKPYWHKGVSIKLPVKIFRSGTVTLLQASGQPIPVGTNVFLNQQTEPFIVGQEGLVYLTNIEEENTLKVVGNQECQVKLILTKSTSEEALPDWGNLICR